MAIEAVQQLFLFQEELPLIPIYGRMEQLRLQFQDLALEFLVLPLLMQTDAP